MKLFVACIFVITLYNVTAFSQVEMKRVGDGGHLIYKDCVIPYELVVLSIKHSVGHLYLPTESKYFTEKNLTTLFTCISKKYPEYSLLDIKLFDDRANLEAAIRSHFNPRPDANPPDNYADEDCADVRKARAPCPLGYNRAIYFRFKDREFYDYSEDPDKVPMRRVSLRQNENK